MTSPAIGTEWRRLHPATPFVKGWRAIVAAAAVGLQNGFQASRLVVLVPGAAVLLAAAAVGFYLSWRRSRFRIEGADLVVETGVVMRRSRRVPLARLQAVDLVRPLVARALGLAELRLEVAGGDESHASLAYLDEPGAHAVRNDLLVLAAGLRDDVAAVPSPPEAGETPIAEVSNVALLASGLLTAAAPASLLYLLVVGVISVARPGAALPLAASVFPVAVALVTQEWSGFSRNYGTVVAESADGLRIRRGLLETRAQTVPPGRIQGVVVREHALWRPFGWVRVSATVAGYDRRAGSTTLLPVASWAVASEVIDRVLVDVDWRAVPLEPAPRRAGWRAPLERVRLAGGTGGAANGQRVLVTQRGRIGRRIDIVPLARVQSLRVRQGPWQRRLRLATVHADLSAGPVRAAALHRDERDARALLERLVHDARADRLEAAPERWLSVRSPR